MTVSVIIPSYNRYDTLQVAVQSVLAQTYQDFELIIVNDCSTDARYYDGSLEKLEKTTVIHLPINQRKKYNAPHAQGRTRQEGLNIARGEWIAFLDDDDYWFPTKLETQMKVCSGLNIKMCSTNCYRGQGTFRPGIETQSGTFQAARVGSRVITKQVNSQENFVVNSSVLIHRSIIDLTGEFRVIRFEDYDYWQRALEHTDCLMLHEPLVYYDCNSAGCQHYHSV